MAGFTGKEGGLITLLEGQELTKAWRLDGTFSTKGLFFGKDILEELLAQSGAVGIRFYFGKDLLGNIQLVGVAADSSQNDILDKIADMTVPCPNVCGNQNLLNS